MELSLTDVSFDDDLTFASNQNAENLLYSPSITLTLKFPESVAFRLYDEFDQSQLQKESDGSFLITVDVPLDGWVYSYLLSFGTEVEVIDPKEFRIGLANYAKQIYEHHKT
jgi:predicted DNA-binding transcriptional regulator YafY